jgi:O-antigen ligase
MAKVSEKLGQISLYFLLLAGPVLGLATKGFAPLLAISGSVAFIAFLIQPGKLKQIKLSEFIFALPFLFFIGLSLLWSQSENDGSSYFVLLMVVAFTACLLFAYESLPVDEQDKFKRLLNISLIIGIIVSISIGSYPHIWPELSTLTEEFSKQHQFANIELIRQSNRSLSLIPIFLFPLAGFYWHRARGFFISLIAAAFFISANSNSQTAFLAMLLGIIVFVFADFYKYDGRKLIFTATAIGLLASPVIFVKSFENNVVKNFAPQIIQQKASGAQREWIYYTYAKEALAKPVIGHGLRSTHNFSPDNLNSYIKLAEDRGVYLASRENIAHAHNLPLQIIFEFGYLGAILFLLAFWWLLNLHFANLRLAAHAATLAAICGLLLFSYSLWQSWLLSTFGFLYFYMSILYPTERSR